MPTALRGHATRLDGSEPLEEATFLCMPTQSRGHGTQRRSLNYDEPAGPTRPSVLERRDFIDPLRLAVTTHGVLEPAEPTPVAEPDSDAVLLRFARRAMAT